MNQYLGFKLKICLKLVEHSVKECLVKTTNLYHSMRNLEKEFISVYKLINGFTLLMSKSSQF